MTTTTKERYSYKGFKLGTDYVTANLDYRKSVSNKSLDDIKVQALLMSMSKDDVLFWINTFVWTFNPRLDFPHIPFITYPFQDEFILQVVDAIEKGEDLFADKSRDMGVSWMVLAAFVWGWLFQGWELRVGSRNRDYVDKGGDMNSLFEKMRYILDRLPEWMLPYKFKNERGTIYNSAAKLVNPVSKNTIVGEATSPNFARGGRSKAILYDEFAFWLCADEAWTAGADTTNSRIVVSTPQGKGNKFADLKFDEHLKLNRISLHWRLHPLKDEAWYLDECSRRSPEEIAQELDISYEASASNKVYEIFQKVPIGATPDFDYDNRLPLYVGWDFGEGGKDDTAMIWVQFDPVTSEIRVIDCYSKNYMDINYFATLATGELDSKFTYDSEALYGVERRKGWKQAIHVGDPYNGNKTTPTMTSIKKELQAHGIYVNLDRGCNDVPERIRIASMLMTNLKVHERCKPYIDAMQNARYPKRDRLSDSTTSNKKPVHNHTSHYRTATEYLFEYLAGYKQKNRKRGRVIQTSSSSCGYKDRFKQHLR